MHMHRYNEVDMNDIHESIICICIAMYRDDDHSG